MTHPPDRTERPRPADLAPVYGAGLVIAVAISSAARSAPADSSEATLGQSIGYLLGPLAGGALVVVGGYRTLFAVTGAIALIAAIGVALTPPAVPPAGRRTRAEFVALIEQQHRASFRRPVLLLAARAALARPGRRVPAEIVAGS